MSDRYTPHGIEGEVEQGSRGRVLRNLQGIKSVREMARLESDALIAATTHMIDTTLQDQRFTAADICNLHRVWLGKIYQWAGHYRQVNVVKGAFMFAASGRIPALMHSLERGALRRFTPCRFEDIEEQATALAIVHAELILIHPFRDGNGRCARLLSVLMGLQAAGSGFRWHSRC
jgi:cell filamentation protein